MRFQPAADADLIQVEMPSAPKVPIWDAMRPFCSRYRLLSSAGLMSDGCCFLGGGGF